VRVAVVSLPVAATVSNTAMPSAVPIC